MRDDFSEDVKRKLAARVGHCCSNPGCRASTAGPQVDPSGAVNVGVASHITAASLNGPRYDATLTPEQRCDIDNGIWLCQTCAHLIDTDLTHYKVDLLRAWKMVAEDRARNSIGKTSIAGSPPTLELYLEEEGILVGYYSAAIPERRFVLGLQNVKGGTAKFPGIRFKRTSGLIVDQYGIDGNYGFGLPQSPSEQAWESFRGGADHVIHPGQLIKIARLRQSGEDRGLEGLDVSRTDLKWPDGSPRLARWLFKPIEIEFEISAEGMPIVAQTKSIPEASTEWPPTIGSVPGVRPRQP